MYFQSFLVHSLNTVLFFQLFQPWFVHSNQIQIILGPDVIDVHKDLIDNLRPNILLNTR